VGVALERPAMELAQLDGPHVGGNEGAGQLYRRGRVLQERSSRRTLNKIIMITSWCGVAQLAARRFAVRQARVRFSAGHHREVSPTELTSNEEMARGLGEWRRMNVIE
jgi:hypothetical protein